MKSGIILFLLLWAIVVNAQTVEKYPVSSSNPIGYWVQKPANYNTATTFKWPAAIDLHGVGGRGPGTSATLESLINGAPPPYAETPKDLQVGANDNGMLIIAPQIGGDWQVSDVNAMIDILISKFNVDPAKIGLTGFSMGGGGVTRFITSSRANADKIAWAVSCNGLNWGTNWQYVVDSKLPIWFFHCQDDTRVSVSNTNNAVSAINALNPTVFPARTIYATGGHSYLDTYKQQALYDWMKANSNDAGTGPPIVTPPPAADPSFYLNDTTIVGTTAIIEVKNPQNISTVYNAFQWTILPKLGGSWSANFSNGVYGPRKTIINLSPGTYTLTCKATGTNGKLLQKDIVLTVSTGTQPAPITEKKAVIILADGSQWVVTYVLVNGYWQIKE